MSLTCRERIDFTKIRVEITTLDSEGVDGQLEFASLLCKIQPRRDHAADDNDNRKSVSLRTRDAIEVIAAYVFWKALFRPML